MFLTTEEVSFPVMSTWWKSVGKRETQTAETNPGAAAARVFSCLGTISSLGTRVSPDCCRALQAAMTSWPTVLSAEVL